MNRYFVDNKFDFNINPEIIRKRKAAREYLDAQEELFINSVIDDSRYHDAVLRAMKNISSERFYLKQCATERELLELGLLVKANPGEVLEKINIIIRKTKEAEIELEELKRKENLNKYCSKDKGFSFGVSEERTASQNYIADQDLALASRLIDEGIKPVSYRQRVYNLAIVKRLFNRLLEKK